MIDTIIILLAVLIGYLLLRSRGGEGLDIKFQLAPASTEQGKQDRILLGGVLALMLAAIIFVFVRQQGNGRMSVVMAFIAGGLTFLIFYVKNRFKK